MAEGKEGFVLYRKIKSTIDCLSDEQAGQLFKHLLKYVSDESPGEHPDPVVNIAWQPIRTDLKADLVKWRKRSQQNRDNAQKRWHAKDASVSDRMQSDAKHADKDKDIDKDIDKVKEILPKGISKEELTALHLFIEMRHENKKRMTRGAIELLWKELAALSKSPETRVKILNQSTKNSWAAIYPLKDEMIKTYFRDNKEEVVTKNETNI